MASKVNNHRYELRYTGAPMGDGEYEVVSTAVSNYGLKRLFKMRNQPRYYGSNSYIFDAKNPGKFVENP